MLRMWLCAGVLSLNLLVFAAEQSQPILRLGPLDPNGWRHVAGQGDTNYQVYTISASTNLIDWNIIALTHGESFDFIDPATSLNAHRFYRFSSIPYLSDWFDTNGVYHAINQVKNQVVFPFEPFSLGTGTEGASEDWVKFLILMDEPTRVYYTDGASPYHYDFASTLLEPFIGITPAEFERISMLNEGRRLLRGTVLFPRYINGEYGIQFVGSDPLPPELVLNGFKLVRSTVVARRLAQAFYIPTYDQYPAALAQKQFFASNAISISSPERWSTYDTAYSGGYAVGRLKYVPSTGIAGAYASGFLLPRDILVTDGVPAEIPYLAGLITLTPATANSHVAILAKSYGIPFVYLVNEADRSRVLQFTNREIVLQASVYSFAARVLIVPLDPEMPAATRAEMLSLRQTATPTFAPIAVSPSYWTNAQYLSPADIQYFGGKAANYGLLLRVIPSNTPPAIAFSFNLWREFMDRQIAGGNSLRTEISNRLAGFSYPPDVTALENALAAIRTLIRNGTQLTPAQEQMITNALQVFDSRRNIRFRSSTNVEDDESFSGAGLYDSYSGCLDDDLDGDSTGPSHCDAAESDERGVFRAIRRVYASFYNDNAFMERLRLGVDETLVGMGVLVHHSTPDDQELANGVATVAKTPWFPGLNGQLVSQPGAVSVANPEGTAFPEQVDFSVSFGSFFPPILSRVRSSSVIPLGTAVLDWPGEYNSLVNLLETATEAYNAMLPGKTNFVLDYEYKKVAPGNLEIKQVREIPQPVEKPVTPFLLNEPTVFESFQGIYGYLWAAHRLKSRWTLETRSVSTTASNLAEGLYTQLTIEHLNGTNVQILSGPISTFPNYVHDQLPDHVTDTFTMGTLVGPADVELATYFYLNDAVSSEHPFISTAQLTPFINVTYHQPVESVEGHFSDKILHVQTLTNVTVQLTPGRTALSRDTFREFRFNVPGQGTNIFVCTSFWLGAESTYGDRPPLIRFIETTIEGLTTIPIALTNYWSQTFNATHFQGMMHFLFEPRLDPSVTPAQLAELRAANVSAIYLHANGYKDHRAVETPGDPPGCYVLKLVGLNNAIRHFSDCDFGD